MLFGLKIIEERLIDTKLLEELILQSVNKDRLPEDQLTWAEYEQMLAEEKRLAEIARLLEREKLVKAKYRTMLSEKTAEKALVVQVNEMTMCRWQTPIRQSHGDPSVIPLVESIPVPPTAVNYLEVA